MSSHRFILMFLAWLSVIANAQITSPVQNPDNSVTLYFSVPEADDVELRGDIPTGGLSIRPGIGRLKIRNDIELHQENDTLWTYTTRPLEPDMYLYYYKVDGEEDGDSLDSFNPNVVRDIDHYYNYFIIPGGVADYYIEKDVPHGNVSKVWYPSTVEGMAKRRMTVYTPPSYSDTSQRFPVLYLLHGTGGDENSWCDCGRAIQIVDNMIAEGKVCPMIVVMPNGDITLDAAPGESPYMDAKPSNNNLASQYGIFESKFMNDIVRYIDTHYRTIPNLENRAIAGLSLGGMQTLFITANNPKDFSYIGLFSPQIKPSFSGGIGSQIKNVRSTISKIKQIFSNLRNEGNEQYSSSERDSSIKVYDDIEWKMDNLFLSPPRYYYIAVGKDDFVKKPIDDFVIRLKNKQYPINYTVTEGAHKWSNWRKYLVEFLPHLFQ